MKSRQIIALVIGCLLLVTGLGMLVGGGAVGVIELNAKGGGGWHSVQVDRLASPGAAVVTHDTLVELKGPSSIITWVDAGMRLQVTPADQGKAIFVGVGPAASVNSYLGGAARDEVIGVDLNGTPTYRSVSGSGSVDPPAAQTFWAAKATGAGPQQLTWTVPAGEWTVAVLNADGSPGVAVSADVAIRSGALLPVGIGMLVLGFIIAGLGSALVISAVRNRGTGQGTEPSSIRTTVVDPATPTTPRVHPLVLEARLAPDLSRGLWIIKWFLAIPHFIVLIPLWVMFSVTTLFAWVAILFTGRYPRGFFDFNVGVLRWTWRVGYYCGSGGLGTDQYPPFTLDALPGDDARLDVAYPQQLSRGLIFVKWLLLMPQWLILAALAGTQSRTHEDGVTVGGWPGVIALIVLAAAIVLLFTGTYPRGLFEVIIGLNRWVYRIIVYAALMTDVYPPFRYDGGGQEPRPALPPPSGPPVESMPVPAPAPDPTWDEVQS